MRLCNPWYHRHSYTKAIRQEAVLEYIYGIPNDGGDW